MRCSAQVAEEIRRDGGEAAALAGDVTADDFPGRCIKAAVDAFGTIDILVNNAGARLLPCRDAGAWSPLPMFLHAAHHCALCSSPPHLLKPVVQISTVQGRCSASCGTPT